MKRKFSFVVALIASVMLIAISCSNASNITYTDSSKGGNFTENGMALLTIKVDKFSNARSILPEEWNEGTKAKLGFKISGTENGGSGAKLDLTEITYEQIKNNDYSIEVQPVNWNFTLTAYQLDNGVLDVNRPVMEAKASKDLTNGSDVVDFILKPLSAGALTGSKGVGDVDIEVNFTQEADALVHTVELDILDSEGNGIQKGGANDGGTVYLKKDLSNPDDQANAKVKIPYDFKMVPTNIAKTGIKAGDYTFKATFRAAPEGQSETEAGLGKIMAQYMTTLRVDGGNLSSAIINIPAGVFNSKPKAPENLKAQCYFAPEADGKVVISDIDKEFAYESAATAIDSAKYFVTFTWDDVSFNEEKFELRYGTDFVVTYEGGTAKINNGSGTNNTTGVALANIAPETNGTMGPDCKSITLSVPMGTFLDKSLINIYAVNSFGDSAAGTKDTLPTTSHIGMFGVEYDLSTTNPDVFANVKVNSSNTKDTSHFFIQAFNYDDKKPLITDEVAKPINVSAAGFKFGGWYANGDVTNIVTKTNDVDTYIKNANTKIKGIWNTNATLKLTYPGYAEYKKLTGTSSGVDGTKIPYDKGSVTVSLVDTLVNEKLANVRFQIFNPNGSGIFDSQDGSTNAASKVTPTINNKNTDKIVWDVNAYLGTSPAFAYGTYGIYVTYEYDGVPISGYYYIKL